MKKFYGEYQRFLKEGIVTDFTHKEALGKLLRFESPTLDAGKLTSLADYVKRMPSDQKRKSIACWPPTGRPQKPVRISRYSASCQWEVFVPLRSVVDEFVIEHLRAI